jgi:acetyl-CoA acetyltransferase
MAGITPKELDLVETSAPFTFYAALLLDELGLAPDGEVAGFLAQGGIDQDGGLAFNTSGGNLSFGQSGQGLYLLLEAVEQLRKRARGRQVSNAKTALVHAHGGVMSSNAVVILTT